MCEFHGSNGNGFGDIWWTDNPVYFSSIDICLRTQKATGGGYVYVVSVCVVLRLMSLFVCVVLR